MNEQALKLIDGLAQKFNTTSEYLWGILIRQARIDSIIGIGYIVLIASIGAVLWKVHTKLLKKIPSPNKYKSVVNYYDKYDTITVIMIIVTSIWLLVAIVSLCYFRNIFIGFYNPEYLALNKILSSLKPLR